ncbi:MAG: helix-turn-helix transcriptional regulator [Gemmatimonadota bacterium]|jgi:PadR family transcriptional regulator PadR
MTPKSFLGEFEQMVLLAILQQGDQAFALEVREVLEDRAGRSVSRGAFYTTLDRLEQKGLVTWLEEEAGPRRSGPLRRFQVTPEGVESLRTSRRALETLWEGLDVLAGEP